MNKHSYPRGCVCYLCSEEGREETAREERRVALKLAVENIQAAQKAREKYSRGVNPRVVLIKTNR